MEASKGLACRRAHSEWVQVSPSREARRLITRSIVLARCQTDTMAARRNLQQLLRQLAYSRPVGSGAWLSLCETSIEQSARGLHTVVQAPPAWIAARSFDQAGLGTHFARGKSSAAPQTADETWPSWTDIASTAEDTVKCHRRGSSVIRGAPMADRKRIRNILEGFVDSAAVQDEARALYINAKLYAEAAPAFKEIMTQGMTPELMTILLTTQRQKKAHEGLFEYFAEFAVKRYQSHEVFKAYRKLVNTVDLTKPHLWYSAARSLPRKVVYHAGPTNSGKTYNALQALRKAKKGVYCGPLRLLAMEVAEQLNGEGIYCNLLTGQEKQEVPGAGHTSCTVEMADLTQRYEVAVLDEIQLIGHEQRGYAWTRALLGLQADEIHVCGDPSALGLLRSMTGVMREPMVVHHYERLRPLVVEKAGLPGGYKDVQPGDCVVAFSRNDIYDIKATIESATGRKVCVVYGALPPEMRNHQARLFNEPGNGFDIMVASDAVGMGLNLNIRRIVFHTVHKLEGPSTYAPVPVPHLKQIAGRAGRRSSEWTQGVCTCLHAQDVPLLQAALDAPLDSYLTTEAGLFPEVHTLEAVAGQILTDDISAILERVAGEARLEGRFFMCKQDSLLEVAALLHNVKDLSLEERLCFCMAPVSLRDPRIAAAMLQFATRYASKQPVDLRVQLPTSWPTTPQELQQMETVHQVVCMWLWLALRFRPEAFPGMEAAQQASEALISSMAAGLRHMTLPQAPRGTRDMRRCVACGKIAEAAAEQPLPGTSQRPYLCGRCKYLRKQARNREPVPLIANPEPVAQLYLKRWAELRKTGVMAGVDNFAQLGAPSHQVQQ